jgi:hypothetical protein
VTALDQPESYQDHESENVKLAAAQCRDGSYGFIRLHIGVVNAPLCNASLPSF